MLAASRSRRRAPAVAAVAALCAVGLAACDGVNQPLPTANRYLAVNITGRHGGAGQVSAGATVIVFEAYTAAVPSSAQQQGDLCALSVLDTSVVDVRGQRQAGAAATLAVAGQTLSLPYSTLLNRYATAPNAPFVYRAGDQVVATLPGDPAVFPATSIGVRLAEPLVPGPLAAPVDGQPIAVTWNASNDPTAAVQLSLRFASPITATGANTQLLCAVRDDGAFEIPAAALATFQVSPAATRSLKITRWRTNEAQPDARTLVHVSSSVDTIVRFP
jgi:hypothetical protein